MPQMSGFDILKAVRAHPKLNHLPVIILTSSSDNQDKLLALDLGATDFLAKPVDPSELRLRVRNTLAAKAYMDHLAYYDPLTKLPNRHLFMERLEWGFEAAETMRYNAPNDLYWDYPVVQGIGVVVAALVVPPPARMIR